jgi:putative colanic acid biosynthesis UDP-glucose lipid carrier transferase
MRMVRSNELRVPERETKVIAPHRAAPLHTMHPVRACSAEERRRRRRPLGGAAKRAMDILVAGGALLALSPALLLLAAAIMLESPGPPLFMQRRGGFHGRTFLIMKFRTMRVMDDGHVVSQAVSRDPRVTRLGGILRDLSIDELPQLINVVRGEMSMVGPRPHAVAHDKAFAQIDQHYRKRYRARPGITGLAQVNGCRGITVDDASVRARIAYDLEYIDRWSIWLDLAIMARTGLVLLQPLWRSATQQANAPFTQRAASPEA